MDRRERFDDPEETMRLAQDGHQARIWTAMPGIVVAFDAIKNTCTVQPAILGKVRAPDGVQTSIRMPLLLDCPVVWQGGGGCTLTFPIKPGDECLVVFGSRCIDGWWQSGGVQEQAEFRMHDLSDGFVLCGVRSLPRAFAVSTSAAQLRSDDGAAYVEINPTSHKIMAVTSSDIEANAGGLVKVVAGGNIEATAGGNIEVTAGGNINAAASGVVTVSAATSLTLEADSIVLRGNVTLDGGVLLGGDVTIDGAFTQTNTRGVSTESTLIGPLHVTHDVTAGGKSLMHHVHSGVVSGGSNTDQPV